MTNVLDLAQACWAYFWSDAQPEICNVGELLRGCGMETPAIEGSWRFGGKTLSCRRYWGLGASA